jgi:signal recognition particle receptor subunit beta
MKRHPKTGRDRHIKMVIAGPANCGKAEFTRALAERNPQAQVRDYKVGWLDVLRLDYVVPAISTEEESYDLSVHTLNGKVQYEGMYEMLLSNADAVLMMIDINPTRIQDSLEAMIKTADALQKRGLDIRDVPMVFQYHRAELASPQIVQQWDELLDLQTTAVPRYFSASNFAEGSFTGFDLLVKATISQLSNLT